MDGFRIEWSCFCENPPIHVVSLNIVKNFILLGDIHKSIYFISWTLFASVWFRSAELSQAVPPMGASHSGIAAHSQLCCLDQDDELFHLNGTGGKILDLVQQHLQAFSAGTEAYEK